MAEHRYIHTHFWDDTFIVELDPIEKLLFLYLLSNPRTDICGAYEISLRRIAFDTGIDRDMILKILVRFEGNDKVTYRDGWILLHNFIKNQKANPSVEAGIKRSLSGCPDWIKDKLLQAPDRLSQSVLLNLTKPNLTKPPREEERLGKSNSERPRSLPKSIESEINSWLDAIAPLTGAKSRRTLANLKRWRETVEKAVAEQIELLTFLGVVKKEIHSNAKYYTPENILKLVQASNGSKPDKWANT